MSLGFYLSIWFFVVEGTCQRRGAEDTVRRGMDTAPVKCSVLYGPETALRRRAKSIWVRLCGSADDDDQTTILG